MIAIYLCAITPCWSGGVSVFNPSAERKPDIMDDLLNILNDGKAHVKVEMDAADLKAFSDELIRRAKDELGTMVEAARKERMLSKAEVKELFGVCDATLWHWANKGILKPVKTGNKVLYPEYEVRKALGKRNQII
jgi:predicted DNA-binding transcriptional regulator AlpA